MAEHFACPRDTCLDLVADEQDVVLVAKCPDFPKVVVIWHDDTGFALDGLDQEGSQVLSMLLKCLSRIVDVVVAYWLASGGAYTSNTW